MHQTGRDSDFPQIIDKIPRIGRGHTGIMKDSGGFDQRIVDFTPPLSRRKGALTGKGKLVTMTERKASWHRIMRERVVAKDIECRKKPDK